MSASVTRAVLFDMYETLITLYASPPYHGTHIAADAGIPPEKFLPEWRATDDDRTCGRTDFRTVVGGIMRRHGCFSSETIEQMLDRMYEKRVRKNEDAYSRLQPGVIPMLAGLRERGVRVGLVSNCYFEEAEVIRRSILFPYFDTLCLSCELGVKKPGPEIFLECARRLGAEPSECLYVGDGGSDELPAARSVGMRPAQALWYLKEGTLQPCGRLPDFPGLEKPEDVPDML